MPEPRMSEEAFLRRLNSSLPKERRRPVTATTTPPTSPPQPAVPIDQAVEALQSLNGTTYTQHISEHLSQEHDAHWDVYLHPHLVHRTRAALTRRRALALRTLQNAEHGRTATRTRIRTFLNLLERRLQQTEEAIGDDPIAIQRRALRKLAAAVRTHRDTTLNQGIEPEPWDKQLWKALDELDASGHHTDPDQPTS